MKNKAGQDDKTASKNDSKLIKERNKEKKCFENLIMMVWLYFQT